MHTGLDGQQVEHLVAKEKHSLAGSKSGAETLRLLSKEDPESSTGSALIDRENAQVKHELARLKAGDVHHSALKHKDQTTTVGRVPKPASSDDGDTSGVWQPPSGVWHNSPQRAPSWYQSIKHDHGNNRCEDAITKMQTKLEGGARHCGRAERRSSLTNFQLAVASGFRTVDLAKLCATPCIDHLVRVARSTIMKHCSFASGQSFYSKMLLSCPPITNLPELDEPAPVVKMSLKLLNSTSPSPRLLFEPELHKQRKILSNSADLSIATILVHGSVGAFDSAHFVQLMSRALSVEPDQLKVLSLHAASVLVTFQVLNREIINLEATLRRFVLRNLRIHKYDFCRLLAARNPQLATLGVEDVILTHNSDLIHSNSELRGAWMVLLGVISAALVAIALAACIRMSKRDTLRHQD